MLCALNEVTQRGMGPLEPWNMGSHPIFASGVGDTEPRTCHWLPEPEPLCEEVQGTQGAESKAAPWTLLSWMLPSQSS